MKGLNQVKADRESFYAKHPSWNDDAFDNYMRRKLAIVANAVEHPSFLPEIDEIEYDVFAWAKSKPELKAQAQKLEKELKRVHKQI